MSPPATVLFYMGAGWAHQIALPAMFRFPDGISGVIDRNDYLDAVAALFFWCGLAFEVPVALMLLVLISGSRSRQRQRGGDRIRHRSAPPAG